MTSSPGSSSSSGVVPAAPTFCGVTTSGVSVTADATITHSISTGGSVP